MGAAKAESPYRGRAIVQITLRVINGKQRDFMTISDCQGSVRVNEMAMIDIETNEMVSGKPPPKPRSNDAVGVVPFDLVRCRLDLLRCQRRGATYEPAAAGEWTNTQWFVPKSKKSTY